MGRNLKSAFSLAAWATIHDLATVTLVIKGGKMRTFEVALWPQLTLGFGLPVDRVHALMMSERSHYQPGVTCAVPCAAQRNRA